MVLVQFLVVLLFLYIGMRVGGIGVGFAGGAGVIVLSALGATPGDMPMLVIVFIMVVIVAIAAMQEAGGIEYLVDLTERLLRRYPRLLVITAPLSTAINHDGQHRTGLFCLYAGDCRRGEREQYKNPPGRLLSPSAPLCLALWHRPFPRR